MLEPDVPEPAGDHSPAVLRSPRRCIIFKDGAIGYAFGVVRGYKLHWRNWGQRKARGSGKIFISTGGFFPVKIRLTKPRKSCGRLVFSKINYEFRAQGRTFRNKFHTYTCGPVERLAPGQLEQVRHPSWASWHVAILHN